MAVKKHFFPGGNTYKGFFPYFNYIISQEDANRIICIKGGPGTGKSSLMKKIGEHYFSKGYDITYYHCSSDNESLDSVVIPELKVCLLDGTAPHIVDPITPGAVDEILNMGKLWDSNKIVKHKFDIINTNAEIKRKYSRAFNYFKAAKSIYDDWRSFNSSALNESSLSLTINELKKQVFQKFTGEHFEEKHAFLTAFTPNGIITYVDNYVDNFKNVIVLNSNAFSFTNRILSELYNEAKLQNFYVEVFHNPLIPEELEHVCIPELSTAIVTSNEINNIKLKGNNIDLYTMLDKDFLTNNQEEIDYDKKLFFNILDKGLKTLSETKKLHDKLETFYVGNMDFDRVDEIFNDLINKFSEYEK